MDLTVESIVPIVAMVANLLKVVSDRITDSIMGVFSLFKGREFKALAEVNPKVLEVGEEIFFDGRGGEEDEDSESMCVCVSNEESSDRL